MLIGRQSIALDLTADSFRRELSRARTFGFMKDVSALWSAGKALGASFENTLVLSENRILNAEGLRYPDEFVRHKALDAVGDLALAGAPIVGAYRSVRGGHRLNHAVLVALMSDPTAFEVVEGRRDPPDPRPCRCRHGGSGLRPGRFLKLISRIPRLNHGEFPRKREFCFVYRLLLAFPSP